ncbi:MAG: OB-fold domain-containing protein [Acidimicrobiales bacterium]|nr:OB-fold domain-containing protein [Acidimicrobiales bacterium]
MSVLPEDWALPAPTAITEAWFTSRTIAVQTCAECGSRQHPPEELCHRCGAMSFTYPALSPNGTLHSYTVAHYAVNRALAPHVPYAVVLVSLDDAPELRVIGNMPGVPIEDIRIGMPVVAIWEEHHADDASVVHLPQWQPR